jgi:hypothetical protein
MAVNWFRPENDSVSGKVTWQITTAKCLALVAHLYDQSFERFDCGWCPVAISERCNTLYTNSAPNCTANGHSNVLTCNWLCHKFDPKLTDSLAEALLHLPKPEWPELLNAKVTGSKKVYHNSNYTLGK